MRNARRLVDGARRGGVPVRARIALRGRHTGRHAADDRFEVVVPAAACASVDEIPKR